jgi:hypothetical protein
MSSSVAIHAGGAVFCSFATPNLSFWSLLPLPQDQTAPRKLPVADSKRPLDKTKRYVTFVTNEGDTPRIVDSLFGAAWADHRRGSVPVAWAIDPGVHACCCVPWVGCGRYLVAMVSPHFSRVPKSQWREFDVAVVCCGLLCVQSSETNSQVCDFAESHAILLIQP